MSALGRDPSTLTATPSIGYPTLYKFRGARGLQDAPFFESYSSHFVHYSLMRLQFIQENRSWAWAFVLLTSRWPTIFEQYISCRALLWIDFGAKRRCLTSLPHLSSHRRYNGPWINPVDLHCAHYDFIGELIVVTSLQVGIFTDLVYHCKIGEISESWACFFDSFTVLQTWNTDAFTIGILYFLQQCEELHLMQFS